MTTRETFAARLARLIDERGVTAYRAAKDAGISTGHMADLLSGRQRSVGIDLAERLALVLAPGRGLAAWDGCDWE